MVKLYSCESNEYEKELNIWATFYTTFNDDNLSHCDNAFSNLVASGVIEETVESVRSANFMWVQELKERGMKDNEIISVMPEAKEYLK